MYSKISYRKAKNPALMRRSRLRDVLQARHAAVGLERDEVVAEVRLDAEEAADLSVPLEVRELLGKRIVREPVAVVGEEGALALEVGLDGLEPLAQVGASTPCPRA
jgi:hypothetical protein